MLFRFMALLFCLPLVACSTLGSVYHGSQQLAQTTGLISGGDISRSSRFVLPRDSRFYIARSNSPNALNVDHGSLLTEMVETAVIEEFRVVRLGLFPESLDYSLRSARMAGADFVIYPKLTVWDDRLGTWSQIGTSLRRDTNAEIVDGFGLDEAIVQIIIVDVASGRLVDLVQIETASGLFSVYDDEPAMILMPALQNYFSKLALTAG